MTASLILFALIGVFFVSICVALTISPKRRTRALEAVAAEMGFSFVAHQPNFLEDLQLPGRLLPTGGFDRWTANVMEGTVAGMRAAIFDYSYADMVGGNIGVPNRSGSRHSYTVAVFASTQRRVPAFDLSRKLLLQPYSDLVELSAPEFSKHFALVGADQDWLRRMFDRQVIDLIVSAYARERFQLSGGGPWLAFLARRSNLKPGKWPGFLQDMSQIALAVYERARAADTAAA
jgi:hypothetical protein